MSLDDLSDFAASVQRLTYQLIKNYELCDQACLAQHGVTASQGYTLLSLPQEDNLSMNELSEVMGLANSTMTRMIDHLVQKGLVYRRPGDEDRRVVKVGLTAEGRNVQRTLEKERQELIQGALAEVREQDRAAILYALEQVVKSIGKALTTCCTGNHHPV